MRQTMIIRPARLADMAEVDRLLSRSYTRLLGDDYPPSAMVLSIPIAARAIPALLSSGRYLVATDAADRLIAAGGWSFAAPGGEGAASRPETAYVRHVATDPDTVRQGVGRAVMTAVMRDAAEYGLRWLECLSTRTAVPFFADLGFRVLYPTEVTLAPGIVFPVVRMLAELTLK
jgi:GNAT superfamily N-acetyltransferase